MEVFLLSFCVWGITPIAMNVWNDMVFRSRINPSRKLNLTARWTRQNWFLCCYHQGTCSTDDDKLGFWRIFTLLQFCNWNRFREFVFLPRSWTSLTIMWNIKFEILMTKILSIWLKSVFCIQWKLVQNLPSLSKPNR